jgi:hypothetical protein
MFPSRSALRIPRLLTERTRLGQARLLTCAIPNPVVSTRRQRTDRAWTAGILPGRDSETGTTTVAMRRARAKIAPFCTQVTKRINLVAGCERVIWVLLWLPDEAEEGPDVFNEQTRLFEGGEVAAFGRLVPVPDIGEAFLSPPA